MGWIRPVGISLAALGVVAGIVAFLFAFWAHQDIRQADRLGAAYTAKERVDKTGVAGIFQQEIDKLEKERTAWGLVGLGGILAIVAGVAMTSLGPRWPRPKTRARPGRRGPGALPT